jgi:ABC-type Mn2+/Zn2+ transport system ATPase subunit
MYFSTMKKPSSGKAGDKVVLRTIPKELGQKPSRMTDGPQQKATSQMQEQMHVQMPARSTQDYRPILSAKDLSIGYRYALPIVSGICFDFSVPFAARDNATVIHKKRKNILGFVGPNGAGKTTFLKTCIGLLSPLGGELRLLDTDTMSSTFKETRKKLAYIPQNKPEGNLGQLRISVRETVSFGRLGKCGLAGRFGPEDRRAVEAAIARCGLESLANMAVQDLSGGQFQRVSIARAIAAEPAVYLFDEPGRYLDQEGQMTMQSLIRSLSESDTPLILVTHDRTLIELCDEVLFFEKGTARLLETSTFLASIDEI